MALPTLPIRSTGPLSVEVFIGQVQFGWYDLWLWEADHRTKSQIGEGINTDAVPDIWPLLGDASEYDGRILHWRIRVSTFQG